MDAKRMSIKWGMAIFFLGGVFGAVLTAHAQNEDDVLRYSLEYPSYDAVSAVMPGVSNHTGFGSFQDNPAAMALAEKGYLSFDLSTRYVDESGTYLGNTTNFSDSQTGIGNLGFVYKFPTVRGSLVVGGGYSQSSNFNRALSVSGYNNQSTVTDFYNITADDDLYDAAFDAYAVDNALDGDYTVSIFRKDPGGYKGIYQNIEMTEKGQLGEYSAFIASEVMEDLFFGATIGFTGGSYTYERDFLEADRDGDYDDISNNTDIEDILSLDNIDATIEAFNAQLGLIYQASDQFNVGVSYEFPSRLRIEEEFNTVISTAFDNGDIEEFDAPGSFSYDVIRPQRLKGGVTYSNPDGLTLSAAAEGIFYSDAEYDERGGISDVEIDINNNIRANFRDVVNFRGGLEYKISDQVIPRIGYAYFASPTENFDRSRQMVSGGFSARFNRSMSFNLGIQYSFWEDENLLYSYEDPDSGDLLGEWAREDVGRLHVMAGFRVAL